MVRARKFVLATAFLFLLGAPLFGQVNVFVDFQTDDHDGSGGGSNGIADWIDELNQATASAGVANFSAAERTTIESNIVGQLNTMFSDYAVSFSATSTGGLEERLYMGVEAGNGVLGFAPLDIGNLFAGQTVNVAPESFGFFIESGEARSQQIDEISIGLAGTAAHELGHSVGLLHHHAYSDEGIHPGNYNGTGGLQNQYIIATGSTGLGETGRETLRGFSPFEQVMLDISGGAQTIFTGQDNQSLISGGGITSDRTENNGADAGDTIGTAQVLTTSVGATSNLDIAFVEADLDGNANDVDLFELNVTEAGTLLAHVYSTHLVYGSGAEFNPFLELLDSTGTVLASNDDVRYDGNTFNSGTLRSNDSFLNNIALTAPGSYYLRVSATDGGEANSNYWLVTGFKAVPEPGSLGVLALVSIGLCCRRKRRIA